MKLISALQQFQAQHVPNDDPSTSEEENQEVKSDSLDSLNAQDVSYSIRRLVRGLASPRESSRLGFAVALTEVVSTCIAIPVTDFVQATIKNRLCYMFSNSFSHS